MQDELDSDDTTPGPLVDRRDHHARRRIVRWDPTFSSGTIALILTWLLSMGGAYGVYTADKRDQENKTAQLRKDVDANQAALSNGLETIRVDVKEISKTLQDVSTNIAVLKARQDPMARNAAPDGARR